MKDRFNTGDNLGLRAGPFSYSVFVAFIWSSSLRSQRWLNSSIQKKKEARSCETSTYTVSKSKTLRYEKFRNRNLLWPKGIKRTAAHATEEDVYDTVIWYFGK